MPLATVPATNINMSDLAVSCGVAIRTNLSLNGLRAGNGGDLSTSDTDSGETLAENIDTNDTSFNVSDGSVFTDEYIRIDSEYMKISHVSGDTLTVAREENVATASTVGDSHTNGATIYFANAFVPHSFPNNLGFGGGQVRVQGYLTSWLDAVNGGGGYGSNTTNIGMKLTFYTNAGSGRSADSDGYIGQ
tara:strand:- start:44 stop:613 length:570 start_codon:yes stop_codon:yes gene_type:complete